MSEHENHTESLQDIMARMGEKFFSNSAASPLPPADKTTSVVTQEHAGSKVQEQTTEYDTQEDLLPVAASTTALEIPDYIQAETFLENVGFFTPSSKRIKGIYTKEKKIKETEDKDGVKKIFKTKISANHELGLPITSDLDYYRAFQKICDEIISRDGRFKLPIAVPLRKLIQYAGKAMSARAWREAREWLERMNYTGIKGAIYRAKQKDYDDGFSGVVFSQVVLRGGSLKNGKTADTNFVWLAPWFLSNFYFRNTRPIDYSFHHRLRKPIAKALYTLLGNGWYASDGNPYAKSYRALCDEFLLKRHSAISLVRQQLDPSHKELQRQQYLERWEYRKAARGNDFVITYYAGAKFYQDMQAHKSRQQLGKQITSAEQAGSLSNLKLGERSQVLLSDIITLCGDAQNEGSYRKIVGEYPEHLVEMALAETRQAHLERRITKTKGAYFTDTIKWLAKARDTVTQ